MALKLVYKDLAIGAAEDAAVTTATPENFSQPSKLPFGVETGAVATLERNGWGLSQDYKARGEQPFAFWSREMSDAEGEFASPPTITIMFDNLYTSTGLTFRFSPEASEFCREILIYWYRGDEVLGSGFFYPDSPVFAAEKTVQAFNRIEIALNKTNLPNRRAKLEHIAIGVIREIGGGELTGASFIHEISLISDTLPMNVMDATFHSKKSDDFIFQKKQPVEAYDGENLVGVYYIEHGKRTGANNFEISTHDAIGILDRDIFGGGLWLVDTPVKDVLTAVLGSDFALDISADAEALTVRGYIPEMTKREALRRIAFAAGLVIDTAGASKIKAFLPPKSSGSDIPRKETYQGGSVGTSDIVTKVKVKYAAVLDSTPEEGEDTIRFGGKNYPVLYGSETATNPNAVAGTMPNEVEYDGGYLLCSDENPENNTAKIRAEALLAYHMRRNTYNTSHVLHDQKPGDCVTVALPWGEPQKGHIVKQTITISNINASNTDFLLD